MAKRLAGEIPGFDTDRDDKVELLPGSPEIRLLEEHYRPIRFSRLEVSLTPPFRLLQDPQENIDIINCYISVRGPFAELVRYRFADPSWKKLPPSGTKHHRTKGFGRATVRRIKSGEYALSYLMAHHALDLLLPLSAMWLAPFQRPRAPEVAP